MLELFVGLSLRQQLMRIILGITGISLLACLLLILVYERRETRSLLVNQSKLYARIAGDYSIGALAFQDRRAATESLAKLEAVPEVECAYLYDTGQGRVASFEPFGPVQLPDMVPPQTRFTRRHLLVAHAIQLEGKDYGSIHVCVSTASLHGETLRWVGLSSALLGGLLVLSALAAFALQGVVSRPILRLAGLAEKVSRLGDYSIRARSREGASEIAVLYRAWNEMLEEIERQDRERLEYQRALQRNEQRFRTIIEASHNAIFVVLGRRLVYVNPRFEKLFGYTLEEISDPTFDASCLATPDSRGLFPTSEESEAVGREQSSTAVWLPGVDQDGREGDPEGSDPETGRPGPDQRPSGRRISPKQDTGSFVYDIRGVTKTGQILDFEVSVSRVSWDQGSALMGILNDITERKLAELQREQELLRQTNQRLERYARALESSNEHLRQFAYVASHDLQEPLRTVSSFVQLLGHRYKGQLDADADEFIEFAVSGVKRMKSLIEDLLAYSRIDRQRPLEPTDCRRVIDTVLGDLRSTIASEGAELSIGPLPTVYADSSQLAQLFQNLIGNAIKFRGEAPPRIEITCRREDFEWVFSVRDNGLGIAPEYRERVFVIFQRLHGRGDYPGTGIGLAICKRIVERHHGRIWLESEEGVGSTFFFTLPAIEPEPSEPSRPRPGGPEGAGS